MIEAAANNKYDDARRLAHYVTFYWYSPFNFEFDLIYSQYNANRYNFMPLSRGTAACGLLLLQAMLLAVGWERQSQVPRNQQVDWEVADGHLILLLLLTMCVCFVCLKAILSPTPTDFIDSLKEWSSSDSR